MSETEALAIPDRSFAKKNIEKAKRELNPIHNKARQEFGISRFVYFISCCVSDSAAQDFVEKWRSPKRRGTGVRLSLDDLAYKMAIPGEKLFAWAAEGAQNQTQLTRIIKQALHAPKVINKNIRMALTDAGFKDRELFFESAGLKPRGSGTQVNVIQSNVNTAAAKSETSLPEFDSQRREIAEAVRADE